MIEKIGASLNSDNPDDAFILEHLPPKGRSEVIKAALLFYFRGGQAEQPLSADTAAIIDAIDRLGERLAGLQVVSMNGNGRHPAPVGEGLEDPRDPLVQRFAGLSFEDTNWG